MIMDRIELISSKKNLYKGNLHSHSTLSDGTQTPEELKELYKANGYSFIAITDHEVIYDNSYLDDEEFITITSAEYGIKEFPNISTFGKENIKVCHLNIYAKDQHNLNNLSYNEPLDHYSAPEKKAQLLKDYGTTDRVYTVEAINKLIADLNNAGFFVAYNHPRWSMENYSDYSGYEGLWGVEIYNHACTKNGLDSYDMNVHHDFHTLGKRIFASCGDDNHNIGDSCGGFVMVNCESLSYDNIISALLNGDFYTSNGPIINEITVVDDVVKVKCSNAKRISYSTYGRRFEAVNAENDDYLTEATFKINENDIYFSIDVMDENGKRANSQAYYLEELKIKE